MLSKLGYEYEVCANGHEAVTFCQKQKPSLVLMDIQMPVMDGYKATTLIRKQQEDLPIIAMTASSHKDEEKRCIDSGMNALLPKPVSLKDLQTVINKWITPDQTEEKEATVIYPIDLARLAEIESLESDKNPGFLNHRIEHFISESLEELSSFQKCLHQHQ